MSKQVRVNVSTLVNASKIRREKRDGRDVIIVPSATLPDNIIMHGIAGPGPVLYPADEIEKSYKGLERTPAPLGHPTLNGKFVSARDPEGLARSWIGAWNENVRREGGRVLIDKVIDVEVANQSEGGRAVLAAIEKQEPIHTSTGLLAMMEEVDAADHKFVARNMHFDHDAILLDQMGAASPEQGVGMFVNAAGEQIQVINSALEDDIDRDMDWQIDALLRSIERKKQFPLIERIKMFITELVQGDPTPDTTKGVALNAEDEPMDKAQFDELSGEVKGLKESLAGLDDKIATAVGNALKPMVEAQAARDAADKAKADADHAALVNQVVEGGLLTEELAKASPAPVLNALLEKAKQPAPAFRVNGAYKAGGDKPAYKLPEGD